MARVKLNYCSKFDTKLSAAKITLSVAYHECEHLYKIMKINDQSVEQKSIPSAANVYSATNLPETIHAKIFWKSWQTTSAIGIMVYWVFPIHPFSNAVTQHFEQFRIKFLNTPRMAPTCTRATFILSKSKEVARRGELSQQQQSCTKFVIQEGYVSRTNRVHTQLGLILRTSDVEETALVHYFFEETALIIPYIYVTRDAKESSVIGLRIKQGWHRLSYRFSSTQVHHQNEAFWKRYNFRLKNTNVGNNSLASEYNRKHVKIKHK